MSSMTSVGSNPALVLVSSHFLMAVWNLPYDGCWPEAPTLSDPTCLAKRLISASSSSLEVLASLNSSSSSEEDIADDHQIHCAVFTWQGLNFSECEMKMEIRHLP